MHRRWSAFLLALWVTLCLGVPFLLISVAGRALPIDVLTCARFTLAATALFAGAAVRGGLGLAGAQVWRLVRDQPVEVVLVGLCSAALPTVLIAEGERHVSTGLSSMLVATTPVWIAVMGRLLLPDERLRLPQVGCLAVAVGGMAVLTAKGLSAQSPQWAALPLAAAASYAAGNILVRRRLRHAAPLTLTCAQMVVAAAVSLPFAATDLRAVQWQPGPWLAVVVLGVVCSGLGWLAVTSLVQRVDGVRASLVSFAAPVVSVLLGAVVLTERLSLVQLMAAGVVLAAIGVFGVVSGRPAGPTSGGTHHSGDRDPRVSLRRRRPRLRAAQAHRRADGPRATGQRRCPVPGPPAHAEPGPADPDDRTRLGRTGAARLRGDRSRASRTATPAVATGRPGDHRSQQVLRAPGLPASTADLAGTRRDPPAAAGLP
jgi:drug/metabolite transporter (DMT)-like permease